MFLCAADTAALCARLASVPRAAAHCVNSRPATDYDGQTVRTAVGFNADAFPGIFDWFGTTASNPDLQVFNVSQIQYDPRSLEAAVRTRAAGLGMLFAVFPFLARLFFFESTRPLCICMSQLRKNMPARLQLQARPPPFSSITLIFT